MMMKAKPCMTNGSVTGCKWKWPDGSKSKGGCVRSWSVSWHGRWDFSWDSESRHGLRSGPRIDPLRLL